MLYFSILFLLTRRFCLTLAVQISVGTTKLDSAEARCSNIQEFSCVSDKCDPAVGQPSYTSSGLFDVPVVSEKGDCRNGDRPNHFCGPGELCNDPTAGHCLENTISASGQHHMPSKDVGTPKHFLCLTVNKMDTPVIVWENADCSGLKCFIPGDGYWNTWKTGDQGNCVDIGVNQPIDAPPCLSAGQDGVWPSGGGFPRDVTTKVGGNFGRAASFENTMMCDSVPKERQPQALARSDVNPPSGHYATDAWNPNINIPSDEQPPDLDTRSFRFKRQKKPGTNPLRNGRLPPLTYKTRKFL